MNSNIRLNTKGKSTNQGGKVDNPIEYKSGSHRILIPPIFEKSMAGRCAYQLPPLDVERRKIEEIIPPKYLRSKSARLPEVSELELVRHYTELSHMNMSIDTNFYPLGSCTMKYNPKINERCASLGGFSQLHPMQPVETVQGMLQMLWELEQYLGEIGGMDSVSLQPAAGAHGELTGLMVIKKYLIDKGETQRNEVLIPDSAHGTNPASAKLCGFKIVQVKSNKRGTVDLDDFRSRISDRTACMMITNPSTLGLFEPDILSIASTLHEKGALLYLDGANLNAIVGITRPGDFGADVMHFNLHKTFSTPHGGGGPGAGPIGVKKFLEPYLPIPRIVRIPVAVSPLNDAGDKFRVQSPEFRVQPADAKFTLNYDEPKSIGKVKAFYGNIGILLRAYVYIRALGAEGLKRVAECAVLNANYLLSKLQKHFTVKYGVGADGKARCMHEFVLSADVLHRKYGVRALDIAKRLLDYGFHAPTIYFPLIVSEALMVEPTETETPETLDAFADALIKIVEEAKTNPDLLHTAPHTRCVRRLDEVRAAKEPKVRYEFPKS